MEIPPDEVEQVFKRLYEQPKFAEQKKQALRMKHHLDQQKENTFSPVISERAKSHKRYIKGAEEFGSGRSSLTSHRIKYSENGLTHRKSPKSASAKGSQVSSHSKRFKGGQ